MLRLQQKYKKEIIPQMMARFGYKSLMAVPKIEKIVVNCGFGRVVVEKGSSEREKVQEHILNSLALITGQKPILRKAKKSISAFKLRQGIPVGAQVTLRRKRMYEFLEKLICLVLPRMRDFRGIDAKSFSEKGDLTIGFREYTPFPELKLEKEKGIFGLEVIINNTNTRSKEEGMELLRLLGLPFKR